MRTGTSEATLDRTPRLLCILSLYWLVSYLSFIVLHGAWDPERPATPWYLPVPTWYSSRMMAELGLRPKPSYILYFTWHPLPLCLHPHPPQFSDLELLRAHTPLSPWWSSLLVKTELPQRPSWTLSSLFPLPHCIFLPILWLSPAIVTEHLFTY